MSTRFVIIGAARTGSTLLVRTLNSIHGICCHGELLADKVRGYQDGFDPEQASREEREARLERLGQARDADPVAFMQRALSGDNAATGCKALYSDLLDPRWRAVTTALLAMPDIRFIHLVRRNSLRRYVSQQILQAGGPNHSGAGGRSEHRIQVHIDIDAYLRSTAAVAAEGRECLALLGDRPILEISYEQLAADTAATVATVCDFLGLASPPGDIAPALSKVGATDLRDTVSNYRELLEHPATRALLSAD